MTASANDLRALAARMARGAGRRITVQAKSAETVAHALRAYTDMISRPAFENIEPFRVDIWDAGGIIETTAKCTNRMVGKAAFDGTVRERARCEVTLRGGIRIVARYAPEPAVVAK